MNKPQQNKATTQKTGRLRTTSDPIKSLQQYEELRASGRVKRAIVIAETRDGNYDILGQSSTPDDMARMLVVAAEAVAKVPDEDRSSPGSGEFTLAQPINAIAAAWAEFDMAGVNPGTSAQHRRDMRFAFYAGSWSCLKALIAAASDPSDEPTNADLDRTRLIHEELIEFFRRQVHGSFDDA